MGKDRLSSKMLYRI